MSDYYYRDRLVTFALRDEGVTWAALLRMFNKSENSLRTTLYRAGRKDLVQRINKASRKGSL